VGHNQLDYRLRSDPRVTVMEGVNARDPLGLTEPADIATIDVSFISLYLVLPAVADAVKPGADIIALFKPQFEAGRAEVPRGGVIMDPALHSRLIGRFVTWCTRNRFRVLDMTSSPIAGAEGNREFLFRLRSAETLS
jgi:23S rRNA (cytidine1920-2'-O)/16S rRNA (cytidine1409-2'-O)-methyltransferase